MLTLIEYGQHIFKKQVVAIAHFFCESNILATLKTDSHNSSKKTKKMNTFICYPMLHIFMLYAVLHKSKGVHFTCRTWYQQNVEKTRMHTSEHLSLIHIWTASPAMK